MHEARYNVGIAIMNASEKALREIQKAFVGVADEIGNPSETDIQSWVNEIRYPEDKAVMANAAQYAMKFLQDAMKGEAAKAGITSEEDVDAIIAEKRTKFAKRK